MTKRPILAITSGDPAGVGPEIVVKTLFQKGIYEICKPLVIGDAFVLEDAFRILGRSWPVNAIKDVEDASFQHGTIDLYNLANYPDRHIPYGQISAVCGRVAGEFIETAIDLALEGIVDGTVTAPINKEAFNQGGFKYHGHTEFFAEKTDTPDYSMMLVHGGLRVVHVSTHVSLKEAVARVKTDRVYETIKIAYDGCRALGIRAPHIGVAGLNPHSGEGGMMGDEEMREIIPAIEMARNDDMRVDGPIPPDSLFQRVRGGFYDIGVAMYHDQGHIPVKFAGFEWDDEKNSWKSVAGVNVTLGIPIIRTSVDHGTAFGKAGKGTASHLSMVQAIELAVKMVESRNAGESE